MWIIAEQEAIEELNEAVNQQWDYIRHLEELARWNANGRMREDVLGLRDNTELISALLNEGIIWDRVT